MVPRGGLTCAEVGFREPPAGSVSLVATNLRWVHAQHGGEQARESRTRTRGRALVAP